MAVVASLDIQIGANTQRAERGIKRTQSAVKSLTASVKTLAAAWLGFAAASRARSAINQSFVQIDRLAKVANQLDLPVADLQAFALAAELAGSNFESINKGLNILQRRASEADFLETARRAFRGLNVDVERFVQLGTREQFQVIANSISQLTSQTDKARLANDLFGRSGRDLLPILNQGRAALDAATQTIEDYGIAVSDVDAAKIEEANDAWTRLSFAARGLANTLAIDLAPNLEQTANLLTEIVNLSNEAGGSILSLPVVSLLPEELRKDLLSGQDVFEAFFNEFAIQQEKASRDAVNRVKQLRKEFIEAGKGAGKGLAEGAKEGIEKAAKQIERIQVAQTVTANVGAARLGSQADLAIRFGREIQVGNAIQQQQLNEQRRIGDGIEGLRDDLRQRGDARPANIDG